VDGIWQATIGVPSITGSGTWTVYELVARDLVGNTTDVFAPSPPTLSGSFVVTRISPVLGRTLPLQRGDAPPPAVASSKPSTAQMNTKPRTSISRELTDLSSSPAESASFRSDERAVRDMIDGIALNAMSLLLAELRQYLSFSERCLPARRLACDPT
jgi:hypothetical protein